MSQATSRRDAVSNTWRRARPLLTGLFFVAVAGLLVMLVKNLDWQEVLHALHAYRSGTLALAGLVAAASYLTYCGFDVLARFYTRHRLTVTQIVPVTFVCYAFNLNLSSWVGGIALRYRLYSRLGLDVPTITRILSLSLLTNWLGYMLLAGTVFALGYPALPAQWAIGSGTLRGIGVLLLVACAAYLLACRFARRRRWRLRGQEIVLPSLAQALIQAGLGALNWSLMAMVIYILLPANAFYPAILGVLLISSIAGVITHIPAGLGVLETVFITLLAHSFSRGTLLAALIGYRALYFLLPLVLALLVYAVLEKRAKALSEKNRHKAAADA